MSAVDGSLEEGNRPSRVGGGAPVRRVEWIAVVVIALVSAWFYFWSAGANGSAWVERAPAGYYGLQTEAFLAGQLHLKLEPHPQLLRLPDPYDPVANAPYRVHDMSLFDGRYYVYFGVTPILVLLLPWTALTGTYLTEAFATACFGALGLVASLGLYLAIRRRLFPQAGAVGVVAGALVIALGNLVPTLMQAPNFYQVPMLCAYFFGTLAVGCAWRAVRPGPGATSWLAAASLAWGLAVAARPNYLPGSLLVLVPWWWHLQWSRDLRVLRSPASLRLLVAAVLPLAAVGGALMAYNHARFGSITEFGMKYQLASFRIADQPLMGLGNLLPNLWGYLFTVPQWSRYFPFVIPGGNQAPLGALTVFPFFWLGVAALVVWRRRRVSWQSERGALAALILIPLLGALLFLCLYFALILRYSADFILWMALGSAVVVLYGDERVAHRRPAVRRLFRAGVVILAGLTVAVNLLYSFRTFANADRLAPLARWMNLPSHLWTQATGQHYGPIRLQVTFPPGASGTTEPLISTGASADQTDLVYVRYLSAGRVQLGFFHSGLGGPASEPMRLGPGPHELEIFLGSFAPPAEHPFFDGWSPLRVASVRRTLDLKVNGETVLAAAAEFYPSSPGFLAVGRNPNGIGDIAPLFTGRVLAQEQAPIAAPDDQAPALASGQPVRLSLYFPVGRAGNSEPLLQTGTKGASDLVYVQYLSGDRIAFGLDHWGGGGPVSEPTAIDFTREHEVVLWVGPLAGEPAGAAGSDFVPPSRRFMVRLNGRLLLDTEQVFYPSSLEQAVVGVNALRHSSAGPMFSGRITAVAPTAVEALPPPARATGYGDVRLLVQFPRGMTGQAEPLVTTGVTGAGDFVYVRYVDEHHVVLGHDHWAIGGAESTPIPVNYDVPHRVEIEMDALRAPAAARTGQVVVRLNGQPVLEAASAHHPTTPEEIRVGVNAIGGSTTSERFTGRILLLRRDEPLPPQR